MKGPTRRFVYAWLGRTLTAGRAQKNLSMTLPAPSRRTTLEVSPSSPSSSVSNSLVHSAWYAAEPPPHISNSAGSSRSKRIMPIDHTSHFSS